MVYPYFTYIENPSDVSLPYALFASESIVVTDDGYDNLFDAMVDLFMHPCRKPAEAVERQWGLFYPNNRHAYLTNLEERRMELFYELMMELIKAFENC
ncbi:hypothetical protein EV2_042755 [Malus domestica]